MYYKTAMSFIISCLFVGSKRRKGENPEGSLSFGKVYNTDFYSVWTSVLRN